MNQKLGANVVSLTYGFRDTDAFDALLKENLSLAEEVAIYLHGAGQRDARSLEKSVFVIYERECSHMTVRLIETTSWLLSERAIKEGKARWSRDRIVAPVAADICEAELELLPPEMRPLARRTESIARRVRHLMVLSAQARVQRNSHRAQGAADR